MFHRWMFFWRGERQVKKQAEYGHDLIVIGLGIAVFYMAIGYSIWLMLTT